MKKKPAKPSAILNRRARFDYELSSDLVVGIVLTGPETRAARDGHVQLRGSFVTIRDGELWLNNASFSLKLNQRGGIERSVDSRARKLLAHRKQIDQFAAQKKAGMSIIPTKLLTEGHHIKLVIALGKGKKRWDKRETIKRRDSEREHKKSLR
ncbi:MAG: SsrA-binding protein SmpB [Candidatus Saccharimonadales bacterium]